METLYNKKKITPFLRNFLSSTIGGVLTAIVVCPLDVIKTRIQAQPEPPSQVMKEVLNARYEAHLQMCQIRPCNHFTASSTYEAFEIIVKYEGVRALWKGLTPTLLLTIPGVTLYYSLYEKLVENTANPMLSGAIARTFSTFVTSPLDMFKTYVQSKKNSLSLLEIFNCLYKRVGLKGFFIGLSATLMRDVPFSAIYWSVYEKLGESFWPTTGLHNGSERPFFGNFISGASAGAIASVITLPADVVKTRQQMTIDSYRDSQNNSFLSNNSTNSIRGTIESLYKTEGIRGFYRGLLPKVMRTAPACAIMISSYQLMKHVLTVE